MPNRRTSQNSVKAKFAIAPVRHPMALERGTGRPFGAAANKCLRRANGRSKMERFKATRRRVRW